MGKEEKEKTGKIEWNPKLPLSVWPEHVQSIFRKEAQSLYDDLMKNKQVVKVGEPLPGYTNKIREVHAYAPEWYGGLYYSLGRSRKRTHQALLRIVNSEDGEFKFDHHRYDAILRDFIFYCLTNGYKEDVKGGLERYFTIEINKTVRDYFIKR